MKLLTPTIVIISVVMIMFPLAALANQNGQSGTLSFTQEIPPQYFKTDVEGLIKIKTQRDVKAFRKSLIKFFWSKSGLPKRLPDIIEEISDTRYQRIENLKRIEKIIVKMDFGINSEIYHFIPSKSNNKVVVFHQGHGRSFHNSKKLIKNVIAEGYAVVGFSMPLIAENNRPIVHIPQFGYIELVDHDKLKLLPSDEGNPFKYLIEPVIVVLNYLETKMNYSHVSMTGVSGGGWTTTLCAAMDTRIDMSFPVSGSLPMYLRSGTQNDWGDYEHRMPELYYRANYLELYIMGSHGKGRKQLQVINVNDPCCYGGYKTRTYKDIVRAKVEELGQGEYDVFYDDTHKQHIISEATLTRILQELNEQ